MTPHEQITEVAKTAPPLTVAGMTVLGFPVQDWVLLLTALYTALQIVLLLRRMAFAKRITDDTCIKDCPNRRKFGGD